MNNEAFSSVVDATIEKLIKAVLVNKGAEYTRGDDRLSNFKRMAAALNSTPESALVGAWMKHIASILDMVDDIETYQDVRKDGVHPMSQWDEKIGDAINYLILLRALVIERKENEMKR